MTKNKDTMLVMSSRLQDYVEFGSWPNDLDHYLPEGHKHNLCIWCDSSGYDNIDWAMNPDNIATMIKICPDCNTMLKDQLVSFVMDENMVRTLSDKVIRQKTKIEIMSDIQTYITSRILPDYAFAYVPTGPNHDNCLFCDHMVDISTAWSIEVPSGTSHRYYGGKALTCDKCHEAIMQMGGSLKMHVDTTDECAACHAIYAINSPEKRARKFLKTTKKHLCPSCFYRDTPYVWNSRVMEQHTCEVCSNLVTVDVSCVLPNTLTMYSPHTYCDRCRKLSVNPVHEHIIQSDAPYYFIHIDTRPPYEISFCRFRSDFKIFERELITSMPLAENLSSAAFSATLALHEHIKEKTENKQLNLLL